MSGDFLLYGATGYVGSAVARIAVDAGLRPVLGGRTAPPLRRRAVELDVEAAIAPVDDPEALDDALQDVPVVLNCAGPFVHTYEPLVEACLRTGTHYLDITGEAPVYAGIERRNAEAVAAGVMLLPGVGFDVLPTDCLAVHLHGRLPSATKLTLAFRQQGPAPMPPGTLDTMIELVPHGSNKQRRVDGELVAESRRPTREIDFGSGPVTASLITWGDLIMAHHSTGIPNIEVYAALPEALVKQMDLVDRVRPLFRFRPVREAAKRSLHGGVTPEQLAATTTSVWGEVTDPGDGRAVSRLHGPEGGNVWTSLAALAAVRRILEGESTPGFQTPATAFGPEVVLDTDGVTREDVE